MTTILATPAARARIAGELVASSSRGEGEVVASSSSRKNASSSRGECPLSATTFVLTISGMPVRLRGRVEQLMADHLPPAEVEITPGIDIWDVQWFTRWQRDTTTFGARGLRCREVLRAPGGSADEFSSVLCALANEFGFQASVVES